MGFYPSDDGMIRDIQTGSSADLQGLKQNDQIFSINNINVIAEDNTELERLLKDSGSSVEIGVVRPKTFDTNLSK